MTKLAIVDTNVLVALSSQRDVFHPQATALWTALASTTAEVVFFDCVMTEAISVLARRLEEHKESGEFGERLDAFLARIPLEAWFWISDFSRAWTPEILDVMRQASGRLNFNDALIALACSKLGDAALLSFDADFDQVEDVLRISTAVDVERLG
jgi:predicted nucleic acid-binding protein